MFESKEQKYPEVNHGFLLGQLASQLTTQVDCRQTRDENDSQRETKANNWIDVFVQILSGDLRVGSRKPTKAPEWVTLKVLPGGFASGELLAALQPGDTPNANFLGLEGARRLGEMLDNGCYRLAVPEHGALLAVVWLLRKGEVAEAKALVGEILPWFDTLRFYPEAAETPLEITPVVSVQTVGDVKQDLLKALDNCSNPTITRIRRRMSLERSVRYWLPMKWKLLTLFEKTLECMHVPLYEVDAETGKPAPKPVSIMHADCPKHNAKLGCGWPCQQYPEGWEDEAEGLYAEYKGLIAREDAEVEEWSRNYYKANLLNAKVRRKGTIASMIRILGICVNDGPRALTAHDVGLLRAILASSNTKRGLPGSPRFEAVWAPLRDSLGEDNEATIGELIERLEKHDKDSGLSPETIEAVLMDGKSGPIPAGLRSKVERSRLGTIPELFEAGLITSGEVLGTLVPTLTAQIASAGVEDISLRRLYYALSVAFRKRRSLLLFNLQHQVTLRELPWAAPMLTRCEHKGDDRKAALGALKLVVTETLYHFPQTILPNKLLQSLRDLARTAGLKICLVDEIAADIFERRFSQKYAAATRATARVLRGTLYETYYGLGDQYLAARDTAAHFDENALIEACIARSGVSRVRCWNTPVAENGRIIEQEQILTTHNLAGLYEALGLAGSKLNGYELARKTWVWIVKTLQSLPEDWLPRLQAAKKVAYAWRQLLFYVSTAHGARDIVAELTWDLAQTVKDRDRYLELYELFLSPLNAALRGETAKAPVLGWVSGEHPLLK